MNPKVGSSSPPQVDTFSRKRIFVQTFNFYDYSLIMVIRKERGDECQVYIKWKGCWDRVGVLPTEQR